VSEIDEDKVSIKHRLSSGKIVSKYKDALSASKTSIH
jgi:hypothetical protein